MELLIQYYAHPYTFFGVLSLLIIYGAVHQYRVDSIIKRYELDLPFSSKLILFRFPTKKKTNNISVSAHLDIQKLAKEYVVVNLIIFSYFIAGILMYSF